jgi:hypothetical protein
MAKREGATLCCCWQSKTALCLILTAINVVAVIIIILNLHIARPRHSLEKVIAASFWHARAVRVEVKLSCLS